MFDDTSVFFFNDTATTEIYTLSLHDALPISDVLAGSRVGPGSCRRGGSDDRGRPGRRPASARCRADRPHGYLLSRSEEHTSELQSRQYLVCRLLLEKKNYLLLDKNM